VKNIVFIIESLQCGGAEKSLTTLLQNLDFKNFNVDLILFNKGGEFEKFTPSKVNIIYKSPLNKINSLTKIFKRIEFWVIKKFLINKKYHDAQVYWKVFGPILNNHTKIYDIAIAYNQGFATYYVANKILAKNKFSWLNTDYKKAGYNINFDYKHYNCFDKIICVSKQCETSLKLEAEKEKKKISTLIIKDISDDVLIKKMGLENNGFNDQANNSVKLLTVGRLAKAKGYHLAIQACKILADKKKNIKWYIIGNGPELNNIEALIKHYNLENHIELLGYRENPYPYMKTCDIYVQTSLFEGLGLTVIEAAILKKPIVTTNFPTAHKIIKNEETGLICEMTPISIANAIERYLNDIGLKEKVVQKLSLLKNKDKEISLAKINKLLNL
jgi:glycosyltransferase involved in cell wall biosynthesis